MRKELQRGSVINIPSCGLRVCRGIQRNHFVSYRKRSYRVRNLWPIDFAERRLCGPQGFCAGFIGAKFNLPGSVRCEHLVQTKVEIVIVKFSYNRRQVNSASVRDPRFHGNSRERRDLNRAPG